MSDPTNSKVVALEKYKYEICQKVKFCDISHHLLSSEYFSKEDCFEICSLPVTIQMDLCFQKLVQLMSQIECNDDDTTSFKSVKKGSADAWVIFLRALNVQHSNLTVKLDSQLHKICSKKDKTRKLRKEDIGSPMNFKHVKHIGHISGLKEAFTTRNWSLRSNSSFASIQQDPYAGMEEEDKEVLQAFLKKAGVTDLHLRHVGARKLILDFIEKSGGMDAIKQEMCTRGGESKPGTLTSTLKPDPSTSSTSALSPIVKIRPSIIAIVKK